MNFKATLPRLPEANYQGQAYVFWTHTFERPKQGWLNEVFQRQFREILLHTCSRYCITCPIYVLMPDHWHLIWIGAHNKSNQIKANRFFRKHMKAVLDAYTLQKQAYDHVIRDKERRHNVFLDTCHYIRLNPVRAKLVISWKDWPYAGCMIPGYPEVPWLSEDYWPTFWRCYHAYRKSLEQ